MTDIAATVKILTTKIEGSAKILLSSLNTSCSELNDLLTQTERNTLQRIASIKTGQTTSYAPGDDGDREDGRGVDFFTLDCNNPFGNTNAWTDENGLQVYGNNYGINHQGEGLGWYLLTRGNLNWDTVMLNILTENTLGYDDWFVPNIKQLFELANIEDGQIGISSVLHYSPINDFGVPGTVGFWSSSTRKLGSANAHYMYNSVQQTIGETVKTILRRMIICRKHYP